MCVPWGNILSYRLFVALERYGPWGDWEEGYASPKEGLAIGCPPDDWYLVQEDLCHTLVHPGLLGISQVMPCSALWPHGVSTVRCHWASRVLEEWVSLLYRSLSLMYAVTIKASILRQVGIVVTLSLARKHRKHALYTLTQGRKVWSECIPQDLPLETRPQCWCQVFLGGSGSEQSSVK